jgi:hypothetical protein
MAIKKGENLAEQHWFWLKVLLEYLYKTAFIHGYKHGQEDAKDISHKS